MAPIRVSTGIVPLGEFKAHAARLLRQLHQLGTPMVITQHGRPAAVVLTPEAYDALVATSELSRAPHLDSAAPGAALPAEDVVGWLDTWAAENEIPLPPPRGG